MSNVSIFSVVKKYSTQAFWILERAISNSIQLNPVVQLQLSWRSTVSPNFLNNQSLEHQWIPLVEISRSSSSRCAEKHPSKGGEHRRSTRSSMRDFQRTMLNDVNVKRDNRCSNFAISSFIAAKRIMLKLQCRRAETPAALKTDGGKRWGPRTEVTEGSQRHLANKPL